MEAKPISILHIEDDVVDAMVMERALKKLDLNYKLFKATNGIEALEMLRGENGKAKIDPLPKIILLDLNMPKMNGIEFLKELRADPKLRHIAVFVMTTSSDEQDRTEAHNFNVAGYMIKPLSLESYTSIISVLNAYWKITDLGSPD
ncbi:MAG: response regulator [Bacteroidia bacterium]|nr:response regulator [Bacteroidia bacterium]MCZ2276634.1 response regulator [Bacteroidia bacterium]